MKKSTIERVVLDHVRDYFNEHSDRSFEDVRRIRMDFQSDQMMVYLYTDDENIDQFPLGISREQAIDLFGVGQEMDLYFISGMDETTLISSVEQQLKDRSTSISDLEKIFHSYGNEHLTSYARQECMRLGLAYRFYDILDRLDAMTDKNERDALIQVAMKELPERWKRQHEQRLVEENHC